MAETWILAIAMVVVFGVYLVDINNVYTRIDAHATMLKDIGEILKMHFDTMCELHKQNLALTERIKKLEEENAKCIGPH